MLALACFPTSGEVPEEGVDRPPAKRTEDDHHHQNDTESLDDGFLTGVGDLVLSDAADAAAFELDAVFVLGAVRSVLHGAIRPHGVGLLDSLAAERVLPPQLTHENSEGEAGEQHDTDGDA